MGDAPREPVGIALCGLSTITADLIRRLTAGRTDMRVVAEVPQREVEQALDATGARFLVVGLPDGELPAQLVPVLARRPEVTVLGLTAEGADAFLYELRIHTVSVGELSAELLVDLVRTAGSAA